MRRVASAAPVLENAPPHGSLTRPSLVSVGTIVWLSSELMFFAALFAMYFTIRSVSLGEGKAWPEAELNVPFALVNTIVLVLSSVTCQLGVWAAEKGQVGKLRFWYFVSFLMGAV